MTIEELLDRNRDLTAQRAAILDEQRAIAGQPPAPRPAG
jgi:hypothetical protein